MRWTEFERNCNHPSPELNHMPAAKQHMSINSSQFVIRSVNEISKFILHNIYCFGCIYVYYTVTFYNLKF